MEKTRKLLQNFKPAEYVRDDVEVYDEAELRALAQDLKKLLYAPSKLRRFLQDEGVTVTPANFYSEIPTIRDIEASFAKPNPVKYDAAFNPDVISAHLQKLIPFGEEFSPPKDGDPEIGSYYWNAPMYSYCDAMSYYATVRLVQPRNIVEIGSGFSTLVALEAIKRNETPCQMTCIEPYPRQFIKDHADIRLNERFAQDVTAEYLNDTLQDGDIFFIDSTHTVKHGRDCLYICLKLLPEIQRDIMVHVHDIYLPDPMPLSMARDRQLYWTEQYLLAAYLMDNPRTQMLYGSHYNKHVDNEGLSALMHGKWATGGAAVWFSQKARA